MTPDPGVSSMRQTTCYMCTCRCGINVRLRGGVPIRIEGDPAHPENHGVLRGEAAAGLQRCWRAGSSRWRRWRSWRSERWRLQQAIVTPKPAYSLPVIVDAAEIESALASLPAHVARIKAEPRAKGREFRTLINPMVVSRDTEEETRAYHQAILDHIDVSTSPRGFGRFDSDAHAWRGRATRDAPDTRAPGGNIQIIGTPEQVAGYILRLKQAGLRL